MTPPPSRGGWGVRGGDSRAHPRHAPFGGRRDVPTTARSGHAVACARTHARCLAVVPVLRSTITNFSPTRAREGARKTGQTRPGGGRGGYARLSNPHTIPYAPCLSVSRQVGRSVGGHSSDVEIHCLQSVISGSPRASTRPRTRAPCKLHFACTRARTRAVSPNGCAETRSRLESWSVASDVSLRPERAHASPVSDPRAPRSSSHRTSGTWRAPRASK